MEDLAEKWNSLSLSEKEKTGFVLPRDQQTREFMLAARFLTPRFLNMEIVARTFKQLWRSMNGFKIRNQKDHRVLFVFDNLGAVDQILKNQPWSFNKHLVMLQWYNSDTSADLLHWRMEGKYGSVSSTSVCLIFASGVDHSDKECELWIGSKGTLKPEQQQFNSSLKAALYTTAGKDTIYVPGYYELRKPKARASS
ncbi:hypothetical protein SO802_023254 [Lithocarpus litseifolius]|uniref:DUF4283 domain-containing protein n=1 Tax=Lithocarpus litseifolius TaxID=425828 RepID=A0AAW2C774_9ROSI